MKHLEVGIRAPEGRIPVYSSDEAAGADLFADEEKILAPGERALISTSVYIELPVGYEAQVRPRSGLAAKHGIAILNSPGTIDSDYRGEIKIIVLNTGKEPFSIKPGDRIAQMVIAPVYRAQFILKEALSDTKRNSGGFGSTGV